MWIIGIIILLIIICFLAEHWKGILAFIACAAAIYAIYRFFSWKGILTIVLLVVAILVVGSIIKKIAEIRPDKIIAGKLVELAHWIKEKSIKHKSAIILTVFGLITAYVSYIFYSWIGVFAIVLAFFFIYKAIQLVKKLIPHCKKLINYYIKKANPDIPPFKDDANTGLSQYISVSQILDNHPLKREKESFKLKYINILEYFVNSFSPKDIWAKETLALYKDELLNNPSDYKYDKNIKIRKTKSKRILKTRFRFFKFYTLRYCLLADCIFINALFNKSKGHSILQVMSTMYKKKYIGKLNVLFDFLYGSDISVDDIDNIDYFKNNWIKNKSFLENEPKNILITANMSAGKSTLINAIVGKKINKTQNEACTAKIHYVYNKAYEDGFDYEKDNILSLNADSNTLMDDNPDNKTDKISVGTYFNIFGNDQKRICFIDTPGVNSSQNIDHKEITEKTLSETQADLLIFLLNGENIGTYDDRKHLIFVLENYKGKILFVVNKLDRFRSKEDSVQDTINTVIADLEEIGFESPMVVPVSSYAAYLSKLKIKGIALDEDDQDEFERMSRKLKKEEFQFDKYFPEEIQKRIIIDNNDDCYQLLLHSGIPQLENIIFNIGDKK